MRETFDALRSLGHSEHDARRLIETAVDTKKKLKTVEEMLQAIYQQSHKK
jgi:holliday junction DNA helicase RuvA